MISGVCFDKGTRRTVFCSEIDGCGEIVETELAWTCEEEKAEEVENGKLLEVDVPGEVGRGQWPRLQSIARVREVSAVRNASHLTFTCCDASSSFYVQRGDLSQQAFLVFTTTQTTALV